MQVILVGHSAGGLSVTDATRKFPNKIRLAVYVAATMLKGGFLTEQDIKDVSLITMYILYVFLKTLTHEVIKYIICLLQIR